MGIDKDVAKFLLSARERGADFARVLMLGNQRADFFERDYKILSDAFNLKDFPQTTSGADFFRYLGASEISAMDYSDYEGADVLHDLNQPIGDDLKERFTFILDGGTLEHVFNFPVALRNAMEMVSIGGQFAVIAGGNNFLGHGFYQFSPELFYRVFSRTNGYAVKRMIAAEVGGKWYEVADPKTIRGRVELINDRPVYLMVLAERIERKTIFAETPQQSDYVAKWEDETTTEANGRAPSKLKSILKKNDFVRKTLIGFKQKQFENAVRRERSFANARAFKLVNK